MQYILYLYVICYLYLSLSKWDIDYDKYKFLEIVQKSH